MADNREKIRLMCVRQGGKLRIRFHSYTTEEGKTFTNVYDNSYNCQFPRDIREEGRFYEIGREDLMLVASPGKQPFYRVNKSAIRIVQPGEAIPAVAAPPTSSRGRKKKTAAAAEAPAPAPAPAAPAMVYEVNECVICLEAKPDQIFIPCAHLCACSGCWQGLKRTKPDCPLCRRHIVNTVLHKPE